ncbi:MAG: hypothetical protein ACRDNZ_23175, partial [Streptosporangiaceae bacterium]
MILSDIDGASSIEWALDARRWHAEEESVTDIGEIWIDGKNASLKDVRQLLDVHTILGNEDLTGTLARRLALHGAGIREVVAAGSPLQERLDALDEFLRLAETSLVQATSPDVAEAVDDQSAVGLKLDAARRQAAASDKRLASVTAAATVTAQLSEIEDIGGDLAVRIEALDRRVQEIETLLEELDEELVSASEDTAAAQKARAELKNAQRHANRMEERLNDAASSVTGLAIDAGVETPPARGAGEQKVRTQSALDAEVAQLSLIHSAPEVADVAEDLIDRLVRAESAGLGNDTLVQDEEMDAAYTVTQLRVVLGEQGQRLRSLPPPEEAEDLQVRIGRHRTQLTILDQLDQAISARRIADNKARDARERLVKAVARVAESADREVGTLITRRAELITQLRDVVSERADLIRARAEMGGGATPDELRIQLEGMLADLQLRTTDLMSAQQAAADAKEADQELVGTLSASHRSASQRLRAVRHNLTAAAELLAEDPKFAWIRSGAADLLPSADADPAVQSRLLQQILEAVQTMRQRITTLKQNLAAANLSFEITYRQLRGAGSTAEQAPGVRSWFGQEVSRWFNHPQLLETIFEGGTNVQIDLNDMLVRWELDDVPMSQPLAAFSSGERAFAYTRAQLALIDSIPSSPNRLIVLDEFGAFMAREWQHRLERYLNEHATDRSEDSTLLI